MLRGAGITLFALLAIEVGLGKPYAIGGAVVIVGYALYCVFFADRRGTSQDRSRAQRQFVGVLLGCLATLAIVIVAYVAFDKLTYSACQAADRARTRRLRGIAYESVRSRAWIARRLGAETLESCYGDQPGSGPRAGLCPEWPYDEEPCDCNGTKWPEGVHCGSQRAYCGCLSGGGACQSIEDCCSGVCNGGRCAEGTWSAEVHRLHCVEP